MGAYVIKRLVLMVFTMIMVSLLVFVIISLLEAAIDAVLFLLAAAIDAVFSRLMLWMDRDQDGHSDAGELSQLAASPVKALNVGADYRIERRPTASITARFQVMTSQGFRDAYDVWFHMDITRKNLASFMPR